MSVKLHLILQELVIGPAREWMPCIQGWMVLRVADGTGYWLKKGAVGEMNVGDGLVLGFDDTTQLRASTLCPMKLQFFTVYPQYLALLTVEEWYQLNAQPENSSPHFLLFRAKEPTGQEFTRLVGLAQGNGFSARCALLQFWANLVANIPVPRRNSTAGVIRLRERFRQLFSQLSVGQMSTCSPLELAQQLNCSLRHFRRLFLEEFAVPFRVHQAKLRLLRSQQLLVESEAPVINIARQCGYHHMSLFNHMFKKRFGMTAGEWRRQTRNHLGPPQSPAG